MSRAIDARYADLELSVGEVVIYDTENCQAWIQSEGYPVDMMR
jgi:hypothetical protein